MQSNMIYLIDFDGTLFETKNRLICDYIPNQKAIELLNKDIYIVSGNLKSHIIETLNYFQIPFDDKRIIGYRRGMPKSNLKRKIRVISDALKRFKLEDRKEGITYIGDEEDDYFACLNCRIKFLNICDLERELKYQQFIYKESKINYLLKGLEKLQELADKIK